MGSQTNRNLLAKFEKSKAQRIEAGAREYSKSAYDKAKAFPYLPVTEDRVTRIEMVRETKTIEATIGSERLAMVRVTERKLTKSERAKVVLASQMRIISTHW
jgi:hypothetical protein